jgi:CRP-like cAMP-binding protein
MPRCYPRSVETATAETLRCVPLFAALDDDALAHVASVATEFECPPGYVLTERGQPGAGLFIIEEGNVEVNIPDGPVILRGPGDFVGELALLTDTPRTARVSCGGHVKGLAISRLDFKELVDHQPVIAVAMLGELAHRLVEDTIP